MQKLTLVVAHTDPVVRQRLSADLRGSPYIEIISETSDLMTTYTEVEDHEPMAVLISENLAQLAEFEVMRALFSTLDVRWLVVTNPRAPLSRAMANAWNQKSDLFATDENASADELITNLRALTRTARRFGRSPAPTPSLSRPHTHHLGASNRFILIGASTGGVDALMTVLSNFPANCPPTFIVQHTGGGFGDSLTRLLDRQCAANVRAARHGDTVKMGEVVIAAGSRAHLVLKGGRPMRIALNAGDLVSGHMPSVDCMFKSAVPGASRAVAALLTGMGRDGAEGLRELHDAGAITIAQDEASCIVYGMPRAAVQLGGAQSVLPLSQIGPTLLHACSVDCARSTARTAAT